MSENGDLPDWMKPEMNATRRGGSAIPKHLLDSIQRGHFLYTYKGIPTFKNPFDWALYPILLWEVRPKTIIEIGSNQGGSAAWLATHGAHPYLLVEDWEVDAVKKRFPGQQMLAVLDSRPLFIYEGPALVMMYDLASSPTDPAPATVNVVETFADRERSAPPVSFPAFSLK